MSNIFDLTVSALREQGRNSDEILKELSMLFQMFVDLNGEPNVDGYTEAKIKKLLKKVCVPTHLLGFKYWVNAIQIYKESERKLKMDAVYAHVAKIHGSSYRAVELAMRFAVQRAFEKCPVEIIDSVFGDTSVYKKGKPTNTQFLAIVAEQI